MKNYSRQDLKGLAQAEALLAAKKPEYRRIAEDVAIQAGLGRFFGVKFRSGALYRIFERTGSRAALDESLKAYRAARASWAELANRAKSVYVADITVGEHRQLPGHWIARLPAIVRDLEL